MQEIRKVKEVEFLDGQKVLFRSFSGEEALAEVDYTFLDCRL